MKSLATIEFDAPDSFVFEKAATGETAGSRAFVLAAADGSALQGISRAAVCGDIVGTKTHQLPPIGVNLLSARALLEVEGKDDGPAQQIDLAALACGVGK
jgi:hypothetical protein